MEEAFTEPRVPVSLGVYKDEKQCENGEIWNMDLVPQLPTLHPTLHEARGWEDRAARSCYGCHPMRRGSRRVDTDQGSERPTTHVPCHIILPLPVRRWLKILQFSSPLNPNSTPLALQTFIHWEAVPSRRHFTFRMMIPRLIESSHIKLLSPFFTESPGSLKEAALSGHDKYSLVHQKQIVQRRAHKRTINKI